MGESRGLIDYATFPQPPSALYRDYVAGSAKVAGFFAGDGSWDITAIAAAAERAAGLPREEVSRILVRHQEALGSPLAAEAAAHLADRGAVAIVTGQQPVLFGGPLYVLYKALAVIEVAARLARETGRSVVPVFWVASDDHDFDEMRAVSLLDSAGSARSLRYTPREEPDALPASATVLEEAIVPLVREAQACLEGGEEGSAVAEHLARAYRPGATLSLAFSRLLASLLPGLVVLDAADADLKRLAAPVLAREITESSPSSRLAAEVSSRLAQCGYHQQVPLRAGFLNAFLLEGGHRRSLGTSDGGIEVRGTSHTLSLAAALDILRTEPARFSAGVLLRPLVQDSLLPTAAYVGGPSEVAYLAQLGTCYAHFGLPRPVVLPRPSLTILDPARARLLASEGLTLADLQGNPDQLVARLAGQAYPDVDEAFSRVRSAATREMEELARTLARHDPTLEAAAHAAAGRVLHPLEGLREKSVRALGKRDQGRADRLRKACDMLFPGGAFQERAIGFVSLLARHGEGVLAELSRSVDWWARGHQVITLPRKEDQS